MTVLKLSLGLLAAVFQATSTMNKGRKWEENARKRINPINVMARINAKKIKIFAFDGMMAASDSNLT
jgi:hypothetical protein